MKQRSFRIFCLFLFVLQSLTISLQSYSLEHSDLSHSHCHSHEEGDFESHRFSEESSNESSYEQTESTSNKESTPFHKHFRCCSLYVFAFLQSPYFLEPPFLLDSSRLSFLPQVKPGPWLEGPFYPPRFKLIS